MTADGNTNNDYFRIYNIGAGAKFVYMLYAASNRYCIPASAHTAIFNRAADIMAAANIAAHENALIFAVQNGTAVSELLVDNHFETSGFDADGYPVYPWQHTCVSTDGTTMRAFRNGAANGTCNSATRCSSRAGSLGTTRAALNLPRAVSFSVA